VKIQKKFFKIHLMLFLVLGFFVSMSLYETTPIEMIESKITGRVPASVAAAAALKSTEVLNIDCSDFAQELTVPAHHVRLEGYLCDKIANPDKVTIQNVTTGKTATLFNHGKSKYMTDFIQLVGGKNQISFSYVMKDQKTKTLDLTIVR
jgi:hypothetical protein